MVTQQRGEYSQRLRSALPTNANESSYWPTTLARDYKGACGIEGLTRKDGKSRLDQLPNAVVFVGLLDQPKSSTNGSLQEPCSWPTSRASDAEGGRIQTEFTGDTFRSYRATSDQWFGAKLRDAVEHDKPKNKRINPDWSEVLMGLEVGTTQLTQDLGTDNNRIDRLRMCGNGVVPQTAERAFLVLLNRLMVGDEQGNSDNQ